VLILQLKSALRPEDLNSITRIIKDTQVAQNYKIKGHEFQHLDSIIRNSSTSERRDMAVNFCARNEIEYLTYHVPIVLDGSNIWDEKSGKKIKESIVETADEAELVYSKAGLGNKVVIVTHLTNFIAANELPLSLQERSKKMDDTEQAFTQLFNDELIGRTNCIIAVENTLPVSHGPYTIAGPFQPKELARFAKQGVMTVLDFSHYQIYANYMKDGKGDAYDDFDKKSFGTPPGWSEVIQTLADSLIQLHINDAKGSGIEGEGLPLGTGEIPITEILMDIGAKISRDIRGTIEITDGHFGDNKLQRDGINWLLERVPRKILG
jgi:sugar phosphate isomerase/epimerase